MVVVVVTAMKAYFRESKGNGNGNWEEGGGRREDLVLHFAAFSWCVLYYT